MDFYTIDSKVRIEKGKLIIRKVKHDPTERYWFHSFILIALVIAYQMDAAINEKPYKWILVIVALTWIYPHLERSFKILFINKWGNTINLNEVIDVTQANPENELETKVVIKVRSGRRKEFIFRTAENHADSFINTVRELSSLSSSLANGYS
jgi:hypothetical protein